MFANEIDNLAQGDGEHMKVTNTVFRYKQSYTILAIDSDASYLSKPKSRSREVGHFFLTNKPKQGQPVMNNGAVHLVSTIILNVISSESEAELMALYLNAKDGVIICNTLKEMVHPHP